MAFNSFQFIVFLPIVALIFYIIPKKLKCAWLLIASYYFYMCWSPKYAVLIAFSTLITYLSGLFLEKTDKPSLRKLIVAGSFVINLGILVFFKYFDFLINNINKVLGLFKGGELTNPWSFILPVGISFYTFQALSYTVDVYKKTVPTEKNFIKYALFVSFFPQLVAGPIERSGHLLSQINEVSTGKKFDFDKMVTGFTQVVFGMFMKMVIADRVSIFVDGVFSSLQAIGTFTALLGACAFALQIYCDFAGYSAIAIGAAGIMGFDLMENFNTPYFADSIKDFWKRWHISLSTWFKDYLYIPMGGSRCSKIRKYFNILVTFLVSGLWHGAAWTYVLWGGIHGVYQIIGDLLKPVKNAVNRALNVDEDTFSFKFGRIFVTFILTAVAWIPFRASSIDETFSYFKCLFTKPDLFNLSGDFIYCFGLDRREAGILFTAILVLIVVDLIRYIKGMTLGEFLLTQNMWFRWTVLIVLIVSCLVYGMYGINFDSTQFIYFQF